MSDTISFVCRIKLEKITESWLERLKQALVDGGCHSRDYDRQIPIQNVKYVAEIANHGDASWRPSLFIDYLGKNSQRLTYDIWFSSMMQKKGYAKIVMENGTDLRCFGFRKNARKFYQLVDSLTRYLEPLYGCVVREGYQTIQSRFLRENMGELTYSEILNSGFPRFPLLPNAIILGAKGKEAIMDSLEELDKLCKKVYVSEKNVLLAIDDIWYSNENEEKIRKILNYKLADVREE